MKSKPTMESFLNDVRFHSISLMMDIGVHRHIVCRKPGDCFMWFEIVTWPGCLAISGDMGTYVFRRVDDMFTFFRHDDINPMYWSEKLEAVCRRDGFNRFSHEKCKQEVLDYVFQENEMIDPDTILRINDEIIRLIDKRESEDVIRDAIADFESDEIRFEDFAYSDFAEYTPRFIWCCYAIIWAIKKYDLFKEKLDVRR